MGLLAISGAGIRFFFSSLALMMFWGTIVPWSCEERKSYSYTNRRVNIKKEVTLLCSDVE